MGSPEPLTREEECERLLQRYGPDRMERIISALEEQFRTLHNRAQVLLGICGILISASVLVTTGKIIGDPEFVYQRVAGGLLVAAGICQIGAAVLVVSRVLGLRWMSQQPGADLRAWIMATLAYRDAKTVSYNSAVRLALAAMVLYQLAVSIVVVQL